MWTSVAILGFFLATYTSFCKSTRTLRPDPLLLDVLLARRGAKHSARELNKVAGLAALTWLALLSSERGGDGWGPARDMTMLMLVHAALSAYLHYGSEKMPSQDRWRTVVGRGSFVARARLAAWACGAAVVACVLLLAWSARARTAALLLGAAHFVLMEVDAGRSMRAVRPAAFVPLALAALVLVGRLL